MARKWIPLRAFCWELRGGVVERIRFTSQVYVQDGPGAEPRLRVPSAPGAPILDPQLSPDGTMLAYVQSDELFVTPATSGEPQQLTFGAGGQGKVSLLIGCRSFASFVDYYVPLCHLLERVQALVASSDSAHVPRRL